jgi:hypothetical protein
MCSCVDFILNKISYSMINFIHFTFQAYVSITLKAQKKFARHIGDVLLLEAEGVYILMT